MKQMFRIVGCLLLIVSAMEYISELDGEIKIDKRGNQEMAVGDQSFAVTLYDNEAAKSLAAKLPMTLDMSELHGNEKYYYLPEGLPTDSGVPETIHAGDLMLFGSDCLVLFYEGFQTTFSYTPLGYVEDTKGLAEALGDGMVQVTFRAAKQ